jgi:hypothetical protein
MRKELQAIVAALLAKTPRGGTLTLDDLGEAIGTRAVTPPEIDAMIALVEAQGRAVQAPEGQRGESNLKRVLEAARALRSEGLAPRPEDIAARTGLTREEVAHALALARVMQR